MMYAFCLVEMSDILHQKHSPGAHEICKCSRGESPVATLEPLIDHDVL